jgi:uncharacterized protein
MKEHNLLYDPRSKSGGKTVAQCGDKTIEIAGIPMPLIVVNDPVDIRANPDGSLMMKTIGKTDLFNMPDGSWVDHTAPMALLAPEGDFILAARIDARHSSMYDGTALVLFANEQCWGKLCYENSADKESTVVTVVTRGLSDDCNGELVNADHVYLAICRRKNEYSFHWSKDGKSWKLARHFSLESSDRMHVGFEVQTYPQTEFTGRFSEIVFKPVAPEDMRALRL